MKKKKIMTILGRVFVSIFVIVLVATLPLLGLRQSDDFSYIYGVFVGSKSKYQGIIEVWNIDTFESGFLPKSNYIKSVAKTFEKKNKGIYVLVRDLTEYECLNLLKKGEKPDIFSCSYGVAYEIKDYIKPFSKNSIFDVLDKFLEIGKIDDEIFGLAWCYGIYSLISTEKHLSKAGVDVSQNVNLSNIALDLGYEIVGKKSTKEVYSLTYGINKYLMPNIAYSSYTNKGLITNSKLGLDENVRTNSQYSAYSKFIAESSVILLGSQRDISRIENRVKNGKVSNVFYEPLTSFTDLIQFSFLANNDSDLKSEYAEIFAKMLSSNECQQRLSNIGMFPVNGNIDLYESGIMKDIVLKNSSITGLKNVFLEKKEIINLQ